MAINIKDYLQNPFGKGASFANVGPKVKEYDKFLDDYRSSFTADVYIFRKVYIIHVTVPSEKNVKIRYDVVFEVPIHNVDSIEELKLKIFSNCPSFMFTYANVSYKQKILIPWLIEKYDSKILKKKPQVRNVYNMIGLEKSIYLAMKYVMIQGLHRTANLNTHAKKITSRYTVGTKVQEQRRILELSADDSNVRGLRKDTKKSDPIKNTNSSNTKNKPVRRFQGSDSKSPVTGKKPTSGKLPKSPKKPKIYNQ